MKNTIIGAAIGIAAVAAIRRFGPKLQERAMVKCHDTMSADTPATSTAAACACG